ncbi:MAG: hypothetical protein FWB78_12800, partial [Treponema sp.]|nr:hypothetical protein [Treponema sp.]
PPLRPAPPAELPERTIAGHVPGTVRDAVMAAPRDALVGIGTANVGTENLSRTVAQTRARAELVRQLESVVADMVADYMTSAGANPRAALLFREGVMVELSGARLQGATIVYEGFIEGGFWMAVTLSGNSAMLEILSTSGIAAGLTPDASAAMWDRDRLGRALWRNGAAPVSVTGLD